MIEKEIKKKCTKCGIEKELTKFSHNKTIRGGYASWCKKCFKGYLAEHKEDRREWGRNYRKVNKEALSKWHKNYREANKEEIKKKERKYYEANKEKINEAQRRYYNENREKITVRHKKYEQTPNGKIVRARVQKKYAKTKNGKMVKTRVLKKFYQTPKGKMARKRKWQKRRALINNTKVTLTIDQWYTILKIQNNKCNICGKLFTAKKRRPTMDHIIPLSKGGDLTFENVQALCNPCNCSKNAKLDPQFIQTWSNGDT